MWCQCLVFFPVMSQLSLVDEIPRKGIDDNGVSFGGSVFRQRRGVQGKHRAFAVFQMPATQNNQYAKAVYFGVTCPELLQSYFGVAYSATFTTYELLLQKNLINSSQ